SLQHGNFRLDLVSYISQRGESAKDADLFVLQRRKTALNSLELLLKLDEDRHGALDLLPSASDRSHKLRPFLQAMFEGFSVSVLLNERYAAVDLGVGALQLGNRRLH